MLKKTPFTCVFACIFGLTSPVYNRKRKIFIFGLIESQNKNFRTHESEPESGSFSSRDSFSESGSGFFQIFVQNRDRKGVQKLSEKENLSICQERDLKKHRSAELFKKMRKN